MSLGSHRYVGANNIIIMIIHFRKLGNKCDSKLSFILCFHTQNCFYLFANK